MYLQNQLNQLKYQPEETKEENTSDSREELKKNRGDSIFDHISRDNKLS